MALPFPSSLLLAFYGSYFLLLRTSIRTSYYIYTYHALAGTRKYRKGALDNFDIVFCAGPHNVGEVRILEKYYNLPKKEVLTVNRLIESELEIV